MASRRLQVLDFAKRYFARWGGSPSYGDIAGGLGISRSRARQHVRKLQQDGLILRDAGDRRGIRFPSAADHVSEVDAIAKLQACGYQVMVQETFRPLDVAPLDGAYPYTFSTLPMPAGLDHMPGVDIRDGGQSCDHEPPAR